MISQQGFGNVWEKDVWPNFNSYPTVGGGTDKSTQTCQNSRSPGRSLYSGPSEYEAAVLLLDCNVRSFVPFEKSRKTARRRKRTRVLDVNLAYVYWTVHHIDS